MVLAAGARARLSMAHAEVPETFRREGAVQGGALASLIDEAAGVALLSSQQPGEPPRVVTVSTDLNVSYLDAARTDLLAEARVLRVGGRWCSSKCTCGMQTKRSLRRARDDGREPRGIMRPAQSDGDGSPRDEAVREAGESGGEGPANDEADGASVDLGGAEDGRVVRQKERGEGEDRHATGREGVEERRWPR